MARADTRHQGDTVDLGDLAGVKTVDWLIMLAFLAFFVLGFAQGTIRRLIGIGSILFSFLFAANVAAPLGEFLGRNWTQFDPHYSYMLGFLTIFGAASLAFAIVVQGFYRPQALFEKAHFVDELLGGLLGMLQAAIILGAVVIILDSFFARAGIPVRSSEIGILRDVWTALDGSGIVEVFRSTLIPGFFVIAGLFIPNEIKAYYPGGSR
jgi:uncharacterized membrane protein required for colicin V production